MLQIMYVVLVLLSFVMLAASIARYKGKISVYYVLLFSGILVSNCGYMQVAAAQDIQAALYGNQIVYLGANFTPFFFLMCLAELCKVEIKRGIQAFCLLY